MTGQSIKMTSLQIIRTDGKKDDEWQSKHSIRATQILNNGNSSEGTPESEPPF